MSEKPAPTKKRGGKGLVEFEKIPKVIKLEFPEEPMLIQPRINVSLSLSETVNISTNTSPYESIKADLNAGLSVPLNKEETSDEAMSGLIDKVTTLLMEKKDEVISKMVRDVDQKREQEGSLKRWHELH